MSATTMTDVRTVGVPVADQDRSLAFYTDVLGFETRLDAPLDETTRWIEVAPPNASTSLALVAGQGDARPGVDTGVRFAVGDAAAEHRAMQARGVGTGELLHWEGMPPMYTFDDPDGNRFYVVEDAPA